MNYTNRILTALVFGIVACPFQGMAANPVAVRKQALQGTYLSDVSAMMGTIEEVHRYGKYVISGDSISQYSWDEKRNQWVKDFTAPYRLFYSYDEYMTGYNIEFRNAYGDQKRMCTGDVNDDGVMDLWCSDSLFYTKKAVNPRR